jgi:hypothetical protein
MADNASRTSSSLNGLIIAVTNFMAAPYVWLIEMPSERSLEKHVDEVVADKFVGARRCIERLGVATIGVGRGGTDSSRPAGTERVRAFDS